MARLPPNNLLAFTIHCKHTHVNLYNTEKFIFENQGFPVTHKIQHSGFPLRFVKRQTMKSVPMETCNFNIL